MTRGAEHGRAIENSAQVEGFFEQAGFQIVQPDRLSFQEQVRLFSEASQVFGIMGAAMCNCIFSPPTTVVGYLAPDYMLSSFFLDMETALGRSAINIMYCPTIGNAGPTLRRNIQVDMSQLSQFYRDSLTQ